MALTVCPPPALLLPLAPQVRCAVRSSTGAIGVLGLLVLPLLLCRTGELDANATALLFSSNGTALAALWLGRRARRLERAGGGGLGGSGSTGSSDDTGVDRGVSGRRRGPTGGACCYWGEDGLDRAARRECSQRWKHGGRWEEQQEQVDSAYIAADDHV